MRRSAAKSLPANEWIWARLDEIAWAHHGGTVLADIDLRKNYTILLLPHHTRLQSETKTGVRLVQAHLSWSTGSVLAIPAGEKVSARWSIVEHGSRTSGRASFSIGAHGGPVRSGTYPGEADEPTVAVGGRGAYGTLSNQLHDRSTGATWELLTALEQHVDISLAAANRRVARELEGDLEDESINVWADHSNHGAVDAVTLDKLAGQLLYGGNDSSDSSIIMRLMRRCATTPINQQPVGTYLAVNIFSAAEESIRREIKDPHIGRKIRRIARTLNTSDFEEIIAAYRRVHPKDELGRRRALAALSAGKTVDATAASLDSLAAQRHGVSQDGEQDAVHLGLTLRRISEAIGSSQIDVLTAAYRSSVKTGDSDVNENQVVSAWAASGTRNPDGQP